MNRTDSPSRIAGFKNRRHSLWAARLVLFAFALDGDRLQRTAEGAFTKQKSV